MSIYVMPYTCTHVYKINIYTWYITEFDAVNY